MSFSAQGISGVVKAGSYIAITVGQWSLTAESREEWSIHGTVVSFDKYWAEHYSGAYQLRLDVGQRQWVGPVSILSLDPLRLKGIGVMNGQAEQIRSA